ncbi:MAG TPA: TetR/AcrR family transcriptional regulator [Bacteroidia bacterium]|nr:TetR/AcrR family transcriptional regulator [Bacteroidia bacterium]
MARIRDAQKTEQIYQATLELVLKQGLSGLKMADVAAQAGLATGTVYIYFKDKDELINHLYAHLKAKSDSAFTGEPEEDESVKKSLRKIWKQYFTFRLAHLHESAFLEQYHRSPFQKERKKKGAGSEYHPFQSVIRIGQQEKKLIKAETGIIFALLTGPLHELIRLHISGNVKITPALMDDTFDRIWESIKR